MAVGELTAINGIAGSYAENVKIVHVVAATGKKAQESKTVMHHTLGSSPDHCIYEKMSAPVRVAHCYLDGERIAGTEIDRVIHECYFHSRPVYIYVPVDMVHKPIPTSTLDKPLLLSRPETIENTKAKNSTIEAVLSAIYSSKNPILLVDSHVLQFGAKALVRGLADKLRFPTFCPFMGKSGEVFEGVHLKSFIASLLASLDVTKLPKSQPLTLPPLPIPSDINDPRITQSYLWPRLGNFFQDGDIVFADGGTTHFGLQDTTFRDITYVMQNHWVSIGYATPAAFGGALAQKDELARAVQLSVQEVGSMVREGLDMIIIIINNGGYSIERCVIHPHAGYHNIATWNHKQMLEFFGVPGGAERTHQVHTKAELETAPRLPEMKNPKGIQVLEIFTGNMDFPWRLKAFGQAYRDMKGQ
ncbi:thiamine diphosphate-binding protein [Acephala macrosclerotiorum]|nr:thiamine diphosphate-binding protein [Acephala macrosclerotiorum]